jgi:drug/metabolite transporter (DMT)-like permease
VTLPGAEEIGTGTSRSASPRPYVAAALAMVAFASNSLLTRAALEGGSIDAASFSSVRIVSGAAMLVALMALRRRPAIVRPARGGALPSAALLFVYVAAFSFAYTRIGAGTGALLLFGVVQTVMYSSAIARGERPGAMGWSGLAMAATGLVVLVAPGVHAPDLGGALLMAVAGVAWAGYTLRGRSARDALGSTARNFVWALPFAVVLEAGSLLGDRGVGHVTPTGLLLAVLSGAVASGLGYALWYAVLPRLSGIQAGIIQLSPAPLAVVGGLVLLGEGLTWRVVLASVLVLSGVAVGLVAPRYGVARGSGD